MRGAGFVVICTENVRQNMYELCAVVTIANGATLLFGEFNGV